MSSTRQLFLKHVGQTSPEPLAIEISKAEGIYIYDKNGKDYIDLIAGVSVANLGHGHPVIVEAVKKQADQYMHTMVYGEFIESPQLKLAQLLASQLPEKLSSTYFVNSGSEAIEGAMKLAKRVTKRHEIISFTKAYHGSTQGAMSLMHDPYFTAAYRPLLPNVKHLTFNAEKDLEKITTSTAAVIVEPIQAEAGVYSPQNNFLKKLYQRCQEKACLLILDEIQTGFGRIGSLFAFQQMGIEPDILCMAKAMGAGMPLGGFSSSLDNMNHFTHNPVLGHITTFGGHPVSTAAGLAGLDFLLNNPSLIKTAIDKSDTFYKRLVGHKAVKEIRYQGLLMAIDLGAPEKLTEILPHLYNAGIHTDWFLFNDQSFRISPPLTITEKEIDIAIERIIFALDKI